MENWKKLKELYNNNRFEVWLIGILISTIFPFYFKDNLDFFVWLTFKHTLPVSIIILLIYTLSTMLLTSFMLKVIYFQSSQGVIQGRTKKYILSKKNPDDHIILDVLDLENYSYSIIMKPFSKTDYFRWGIKLAKTKGIPQNRLSIGSQLVHLAKDAKPNLNDLYFAMYDDKNVLGSFRPLLMPNYNHEEVEIELVCTDANTNIRVIFKGHEIFQHTISDRYLFGRIMAWGDGNDFKIETLVKPLKK